MKTSKRFFKWALLAALACLAVTAVCNAWVCISANKNILTREEAVGLGYDCVLVLGCGVLADGTPTVMLSDRIDEGVELYRLGAGKKLLMSGDHGTEEYDEVAAMKQRALEKGVPEEDIFKDHAGFSTYESLYRAKVVFGADKVVIVTQKYHLYRALYIAKSLGLDAVGVASDPREYRGELYRQVREYVARVKDSGMCLFKPLPTYLGELIPISGDGRLTEG